MVFADVIISDQSAYAALILVGLVYLVHQGVIPLRIEIGNWFRADFRKTRTPSKRLKTPKAGPTNKLND
jgi:hypothetical protein